MFTQGKFTNRMIFTFRILCLFLLASSACSKHTGNSISATSVEKKSDFVLSKDEREQVLGLSSICGAAVEERFDGRVIGCACCAPFEDCGPSKPPRIPEGFSDRVYPMRGRYVGHFLDSRELAEAVVFEGCEPGSHHRGGTMLYQRKAGELQYSHYITALNPDRCAVVPVSGGLDRLACLTRAEMGGTSYELLDFLDLRKRDDPGSLIAHLPESVIASLDRDRICLNDEGPYVIAEVSEMRVEQAGLHARLVLTTQVQQGVATRAHLATCTSDDIAVPTNLPPPRVEHLVFESREDTLVPDAPTHALLERIGALPHQQ